MQQHSRKVAAAAADQSVLSPASRHRLKSGQALKQEQIELLLSGSTEKREEDHEHTEILGDHRADVAQAAPRRGSSDGESVETCTQIGQVATKVLERSRQIMEAQEAQLQTPYLEKVRLLETARFQQK